MSKLTLSVDPLVAERAKRYAKQKGVSVSRLVETYLTSVSNSNEVESTEPPILHSLRGSLKKANIDDYRKHLAAKYR